MILFDNSDYEIYRKKNLKKPVKLVALKTLQRVKNHLIYSKILKV